MPKYRKKIWAGDVYEVEEFYCPRTIGKKYERGRRENLTGEEQAKRNLAIARKNLTRLINANFTGQDYFVLLTQDSVGSMAEAQQARRNFFDRLKRYRKKNGFADLKYIAVLEEQGRIHHHIVMNGFDGFSLKEAREILQGIWGRGLVLLKRLSKNQPDNRLASYLTKENIRKGAKRWSSSRNLKQPRIEIEIAKETKRKTALRVPKGYQVVLATEDFFAEIGWVRYLKAIREGGMDFGEFEEKRRSLPRNEEE